MLVIVCRWIMIAALAVGLLIASNQHRRVVRLEVSFWTTLASELVFGFLLVAGGFFGTL